MTMKLVTKSMCIDTGKKKKLFFAVVYNTTVLGKIYINENHLTTS